MGHTAQKAYPAPVPTLKVDENACPTKAGSSLPKYTDFFIETKNNYWFLRKSRHVVILHSFVTHKIILLC